MLAHAEQNPETWLVTGGAGFIGSHLIQRLLLSGQTVVVLDNLSTGEKKNIDEVLCTLGPEEQSRFHFHEGDIKDLRICKAACKGVSHVLHHAGFVSVPQSLESPLDCHASNVTGFINLVLSARESGVRSFVYASSSAVYGDDCILPQNESHLGKPISIYGASKRINEIYADAFSCNSAKIQFTGLRYFNVFGTRQNPLGGYAAVIPKWIMSMMKSQPCVINGDGSITRDFCPVEDVVQANILAALHASPAHVEKRHYDPSLKSVTHPFQNNCESSTKSRSYIFNVARGEQTTLLQLHDMIAEALDRSYLRPIFLSERVGDIIHSEADIFKIKSTLGFEPSLDLKFALKNTVEWYLDN